MEFVFILIALGSLVLIKKESSIFNSLIALFFISALGILQIQSLEKPNYNFLILPLGYLFINLFLTKLNKLEAFQWRFLLPIFLTGILLIPLNNQVVFDEYIIDISDLSSIMIVFFGAFIIPVAHLKTKLIGKLFDIENTLQLENAVVLVLAAIGIFISNFFISTFGVYLLGVGFLSTTYYYKNSFQNTVIFILLFSSLNLFFKITGNDVLDLSLGKSAEGLLFGGALFLLLQSMGSARKYGTLAYILSLFLTVLLFSGLLLVGTQKTDFGGVDSFLIALLALSFGFALDNQNRRGLLVVSLMMGLGLLLAPLTINSEEMELNKTNLSPASIENPIKSEEKTNLFESKGLLLDSIIGEYTINPETVQMNFELGPKGGRTKGAFKKISGSISLKKNLSSSTFEINLPVNELTTFNKYRDESLMDAGYFNLKKFNKMIFSASKMTKNADYYEVSGNFSMLGNVKNLMVQIKYIGKTKEGNPILVGKSSLDRTQFGMKPDPKEGNVVDFEFNLELLQK